MAVEYVARVRAAISPTRSPVRWLSIGARARICATAGGLDLERLKELLRRKGYTEVKPGRWTHADQEERRGVCWWRQSGWRLQS
jgi:hypothetical protein